MRKQYKPIFLVNIIGILLGMMFWIFPPQTIMNADYFIHPVEPYTNELEEDIVLHARLYYPSAYSNHSTKEWPAFLLFHGVTRTLEDNARLAELLVIQGFVVLSLDFRGHGESSGQFPVNNGTAYNISFNDALGAYQFVRSLSGIDQDQIHAFGISLGGGAALFLARNNNLSRFIVWFPGVAYTYGTEPLYNQTFPTGSEGLILAGTADECARCAPEFISILIDKNPQFDLQWLEGATHTDSRFYLSNLETMLSYLYEKWDFSKSNVIKNWYYSGYIGLGIGFLVILIDIGAIVRWQHQKRVVK